MSKQGIYKISGNTKPKVGELVTYRIDEWYPSTPLEKRNPALVTWHLFKKINGKFVPTNIKKLGVSSFTFNTNAYKDAFRIEAYLHNPEGKAPMALEIQPQPSDIPRINKVELKYIDDTPGTVFSFMEKLVAEAKCTNLEAQYLQFSLWEDDASNSGHSNNNLLIESKKEKVKNGIARAEFMLTKALMRKAMQGETNPQQLEFYVTVEYYSHKKHATNNINVNTPDELRTPSGQPQPQQPTPQQPQPALPPAQPEPDPQSAHGSAHNTQPPTPAAPGGASPTTVNPTNIEDLLDAYFAKKEYTKQTGEEDGTHTYTFGGTKNGNKTGTAEEKNKVAQTILGKIKDSLKSQKKYTTLEVIAASLTAQAYGKDTTNEKTVTFKTFKLGADFKKIDSAPLDDKLYLVARTMLLDGKQVTISIKEKDGLIKGSADALLSVLEITEEQMEQKPPTEGEVPGTEKTVFTGTVKDNIVKIPIHLRPKSEEDLKQWKDKISKGKEDGTYTYKFGGPTSIKNDADKKSIAGTILKNAREGKRGNLKIEDGKTTSVEEIEKVLEIKDYSEGNTITFKLLKKVPEFLYLHAKAQGEKQHDKEFLKKEGAYFQIGNKCPRCSVLTREEIKGVFPSLSDDNIIEEMINSFNKYCEAFKVNTCTLKAHFFAQAKQESGDNLTPAFRGETMNYTVAGLKNTGFMNVSSRHLFGRKTGVQMAEELGRPTSNSPALTLEQQIKVANFVYGLDPKAATLGNKAPANNQSLSENDNEGWRYRGRGMLQITGKDNYTKIEKHVNEVLKSNVLNIKDGRRGSEVFTLTEALLTGLGDWHMHKMYVPAEAGATKEACLGVIKIINSATKSKTKRIAHLIGGTWYENDDETKRSYNIDFKDSMASIFRVSECELHNKTSQENTSQWHDPVDNPRRTKYNSAGNIKPVNGAYGDVRDSYTKYHSGLDLFALPYIKDEFEGTPVYACLDGEVVESTPGNNAGQTIRIKIDNVKDLLEQEKIVNYKLEFSRGEEMGINIKETDEVYFIYMHLSKRLVHSGKVTAGTLIGYSGVSGSIASNIPSPHLHLEIATVMNAYGTGKTKRTNPARFIKLNSYDTSDQDDAANYKYKQDGTKTRWNPPKQDQRNL
ncbi:M23 family metallopeptidase [Chryseobacterium pennipullorum]|uniref:Peptidase M23 domain-containing protein n=1 Tax=Chryseobacterium pennipullorum TaxID=2258963 RepID=A0A3D9B4K8_9FLAO|nr:M23 family metallopeptidase [Chryseobacterium pennipullorum]REC48584.1 hypothetical protein DRF67_07125 [Chryseobacterium pennipullorum]